LYKLFNDRIGLFSTKFWFLFPEEIPTVLAGTTPILARVRDLYVIFFPIKIMYSSSSFLLRGENSFQLCFLHE